MVQRQDGYYIDDLGSLNGTYVNRRRIESHRSRTATRSRSASTSSVTWSGRWRADEGGPDRTEPARATARSVPRKALTIGAVAKILGQEFDDISISKIRYLEDQKLLAPRRTAGGYRLYSQADVERLRAILRMQRDEFLPLRVIRQELQPATSRGRPSARADAEPPRSRRWPRSRARTCSARRGSAQFLSGAPDFGIVSPARDGRDTLRRDRPRDRPGGGRALEFGVGGRNLRVFKTSADREASLLELLGAQLRSRSQARRKEAVENLESLAAVCGHLKHLLLVRDLRRLTGAE